MNKPEDCLVEAMNDWQRGYNNAAYDCGKGHPGRTAENDESEAYKAGYAKGFRDYFNGWVSTR